MAEAAETGMDNATTTEDDLHVQKGRLESVVDIKPAVEYLTMRNLDTGEVFIIGEKEPDFDFNTFELSADGCEEPIVDTSPPSALPGGADPKKNNSGWWDRMLHWIYTRKNKDGSSSKIKMNQGPHMTQSSSKSKTPFTKLSSFKFHRELGKGAFGRVLLAEAKIDGRLYALKIISKKDMRSSDKRQAKAERDILLAMSHSHSHPFTTGLKFAFQSAHNLYLGMDFFPGGTLKELIKKQGHLCEDWVRFYSAELILAISHLHSLHVIYRDIKPHNIMIDCSGHIILIDYGLSKQAVSDSRGAQSLVGTPDYSAPEVLKTGVYRIEQANKEKERKIKKQPAPTTVEEAPDIGYGKAADWWSVGVMMYEMLSGTPAFRGKDLRQTYQRVLFADLVFEPADRFSDDAKEILRGLLQRDPTIRLGAGENPPTDIMSMNFFRGIDWVSIFERQENGPVVPPPVNLGQRTKSRTGSGEYSTGPGMKLNMRDSILSPGNLLNDPNALQDWSFFDEAALDSAVKDADKDTVVNTQANAALGSGLPKSLTVTASGSTSSEQGQSTSTAECAPAPVSVPVSSPEPVSSPDQVDGPITSLAHMTVDSESSPVQSEES